MYKVTVWFKDGDISWFLVPGYNEERVKKALFGGVLNEESVINYDFELISDYDVVEIPQDVYDMIDGK